MSAEKVSVVIPTRGRADLLIESLNSVLDQTIPPAEVIVVDDGSDIPIADELLVRNYQHSSIRVIRLQEGRGANHARNVGVQAARSKFVAFQDSDDVWLPTKLEAQLAAAASLDASRAFVYCPIERRLSDGRVYVFPASDAPRGPAVMEKLRRGNFISTQTVLAARELLLRNPFNPSLPRLQDWEAWIRVCATADIAVVGEPLAVSRETSQSISTNSHLFDRALPMLIGAHKKFFSSDWPAYAHWSRAAAAASARQHHFARATLWTLRMLAADLRSTRSIARGKLPRISENGAI